MKKGMAAIVVAWILVGVLVAGVFVYSVVAENRANKQKTSGECSVDSDCVPDGCCHASTCTTEEEKPDCQGIKCTMECVPNTLDCGQGSCKCKDSKCVAEIK